MDTINPIYVALDISDLYDATIMARLLSPYVGGFKLGLEFFNANGLKGVDEIVAIGKPVFLDLKLHDIPETVAKTLRLLKDSGIAMVNVHAQGGQEMMEAAVNEIESFGENAPLLIGVTVLTSLTDNDLCHMGMNRTVDSYVTILAQLSERVGLDGVVCSPHEIETIRRSCGPDFKLVTPGIRPLILSRDDQKRKMTPKEAIDAGSDILIIGRPIIHAEDPEKTLKYIIKGIGL